LLVAFLDVEKRVKVGKRRQYVYVRAGLGLGRVGRSFVYRTELEKMGSKKNENDYLPTMIWISMLQLQIGASVSQQPAVSLSSLSRNDSQVD
jgi:hypothetical protein